jgi:hypothetical protein
MAASPQNVHRRRVLEYQTRLEAERRAAVAAASDPQLRIPLIGEVKRSDGTPQSKRGRQRSTKRIQPDLGDL